MINYNIIKDFKEVTNLDFYLTGTHSFNFYKVYNRESNDVDICLIKIDEYFLKTLKKININNISIYGEYIKYKDEEEETLQTDFIIDEVLDMDLDDLNRKINLMQIDYQGIKFDIFITDFLKNSVQDKDYIIHENIKILHPKYAINEKYKFLKKSDDKAYLDKTIEDIYHYNQWLKQNK